MDKMKKLIYSIIHSLSLVSISSNLQAANHVLAFGASGEPTCIEGSTNIKNQKPKCESTLFDTNISQLSHSLKSIPSWNYDVSFNGGHKTTEELLKTNFKKSTPFDAIEYERLLGEYIEKMKSGAIKKGESLVVVIDTHGAERSNGQKTHLVSAGYGELKDLNSLSGSTLISLDQLEKLISVSKEKGINLGIVDLSCHSGATMALKKNAPHACIVTSTGPDHYGYGGGDTFGKFFLGNMRPGMTMEKAFLEARARSIYPDYPMISTDEGLSIFHEMQNLISPFLKYQNETEGKLVLALKAQAENPTCHYVDQFESLMKLILDLKKVSDKTMNSKLDLFQDKIQQYFKLQKSLYQSASQLGLSELNKSENYDEPVFVNGKNVETFSRTFTIKDIIEGDHEETLKSMDLNIAKEKNKKPIDLPYLGKLVASKNIFKRIDSRKKDLLAQFPNLKNSKDTLLKLAKSIGDSKSMSSEIAKLEKEIFDDLYKKRQTLNFEDPCRKIAF